MDFSEWNYFNKFSLTNLESGEYVINIMEFFDPTDTSSPLICSLIDTISIEQTIDITAIFSLKNVLKSDSADVSTLVYGGTPPYSLLWTHSSETTLNIENVPPTIVPYVLSITDAMDVRIIKF